MTETSDTRGTSGGGNGGSQSNLDKKVLKELRLGPCSFVRTKVLEQEKRGKRRKNR